jgi:phosphate transport system substrate-binding protein
MERRPRATTVAIVLVCLATAAACGGRSGNDNSGVAGGGGSTSSDLSGTITADGSSTVGPMTTYAAEQFQQQNPNVNVTVGISGTGGGFERFCAGETDLSDASRPIDPEKEAPLCKQEGINYNEFLVANDGITVVVNKENTWAKCLTVDQLNKIWADGSTVNNWNQIDPSFPDQSLSLFGAGTDSGTFDFFTDKINGEEGSSRSDYQATEDDNTTVRGVEGDKGGLGYFGYSYYVENQDKLTAVQIDDGNGCVSPSTETIQSGDYSPLSRPLFIYAKTTSFKRPEVEDFIKYIIDNESAIAETTKFVPLTTAQESQSKDELSKALSAAGA